MGLPPTAAVEPIKAALTEEVFALITEQHSIPLVALNTHLHLRNSLLLHDLGLLKLTHEITIPLHEISEILDILHLPLLPDSGSVVPKSSLQHVNEVRLVLDVHDKDASHLDDIVYSLHKGINTSGLALPSVDVGEEELYPELHDRLPVRDGLLVPGNLEHLPVLVVVRMLPGRLLSQGILPVHHSLLDELEVMRRMRLVLERCEDPGDILICVRIEAKVAHIFLLIRLRTIRAVQDTRDNGVLVRALLQSHLDLFPGYAERAPRSLVEEPHVSVIFALDDREELIPDFCDVRIPFEHRVVFWNWALRQIDYLELGAKGTLACHEDDLIFLPLDDHLEAYGDVVLPLDLVL
mmetsp:Transcript_35290/g.63641  ORF Transcript_35290/g.63641 Transcript_35290/m.63641 type:complete len:351 (+) Transcript_35290:556-1608(+)